MTVAGREDGSVCPAGGGEASLDILEDSIKVVERTRSTQSDKKPM